MSLFIILFILGLALIFWLAYYGLPEKKIPAPPHPKPEEIMKDAAAWRLEGDSDIAFLLCHGFGDSPYNIKPLGEHIYEMGYTAIGVLLPGHGTTIAYFNKSRYYHWRDHLEKIYLKERGNYRHLFLVGLSMGGTLCLDVAAKNADIARPAGIITISSPVFFNGFYNGKLIIEKPLLFFTGIIKIFRPLIPKLDRSSIPSVKKMNPWIGYGSAHAVHALHSLKISLKSVRKGLDRIIVPYCNIMSKNDKTVSPENQMYIYSRIQSRDKRAYQFALPQDQTTMHALLTHKRAFQKVFNFIDVFIQDVLKQYCLDSQNLTQKERKKHKGIFSFVRKMLQKK